MSMLTRVGLAAIAVAGTVVIGGATVSAHGGGNMAGRFGDKKLEVAAEVLGVEKAELETKLESSTFEEVLAEYGYESDEAFQEAAEPIIRQNLADKGLSEEEINEKITNMAQRRAIHEDVEAVFEEVLGLSRDEVKALRDDDKSFQDILSDAGFADKDAFHEQVSTKLGELWTSEGIDADTIAERLERMENRSEHRRDHMRAHAQDIN